MPEGQLHSLQALSLALSAATTDEDIAAAIVEHGVDALDEAGACIVGLVEGNQIRTLDARGLTDDGLNHWRTFALDAPVPLTEVIRTRQPLFYADRAQFLAAYPHRTIIGAAPEAVVQAVAAIPLIAGDSCLGGIGLSFRTPRPFDERERAFILTIARQCAQAFDRLRQQAAARREAEQLAVVVDSARIFAAADTSLKDALDRISLRFAEVLGDTCAIMFVSDDGQWIDPAVIRNVDPEVEDLARRVLASRRRPATEGLIGKVLETRTVMHVPVLDPEAFKQALDPAYRPYAEKITTHAITIAPLITRGRVTGVVVMTRIRAGQPYTASERALLGTLADHAALAIERARLLEETRSALRLRDQFLSVASHELKTPVAALALQVEALRRALRGTEAETSVAPRIAGVQKQMQRLGRLTDDLLDITRLQAGRVTLQREDVLISDVVREIVEREREHAEVAIELTIVNDAHAMWDRSRIDQIVTNLIANAVKYGTPPIEITVDRGTITVTDHGEGVPLEHRTRIFEAFYRGSAPRGASGFGLGLFIVKTFVEAHEGRVHVESGADGGARFVVALPHSDADASGAAIRSKP